MAEPTFASPIPDDVDLAAAERGAAMLGLPLKPQGVRVAQLLEARNSEGGALYPETVIQMPRRATKTTSIWATIIGRAATREGYRCVVTAQRGTIASRILLEHANLLLGTGSAVESREKDQPEAAGKVVLYRSGGRESLEFPTRSRIWVVPPEAGAVRSAAADDVVIDEAGEFDPVKGKDFYDAVVPLMDTRGPLAQVIVTGTPGKVRAGMFWDTLELGRSGEDAELGILDYSVRDDEDVTDRAVWARVHPGPASGLTPMEVLERRWKKLGEAAFSREYLCRWPADISTSAIDLQAWREHVVPQEALPSRFGLAFDVAPDSSAAALMAAWRDEQGIARIGVLDYRDGVSWLPAAASAVARKYRVPIRHDGIGANYGPAQEIQRQRGVSVVASTPKETMAATQALVSALADGELVHFDQASLNTAAEGAAWRQGEGGRYFARKASAADVCPLVGAAQALWQVDHAPAGGPTRVIRASA